MKKLNIRFDVAGLKDMQQMEQAGQQVQAALDGGADAGKELLGALQRARQATQALATTGARLRRMLAGFDQITRLAKATGSAGSKQEELMDSQALMAALEQADAVEQKLQSLYTQVLQPLGGWVRDVLVPGFGEGLVQAFSNVSQAVPELTGWVGQLWQKLQGSMDFIQTDACTSMAVLKDVFTRLTAAVIDGTPQINGSLTTVGRGAKTLWETAVPLFQAVRGEFEKTMGKMDADSTQTAEKVTTSLQGVSTFLSGTFTKNWTTGFSGLKTPVGGTVNGIIGFLNKMLSGLSGALNGVIGAANQLSFTVPSWIPGLGGTRFGFSLSKVAVQQIPYLAQGAVLPANRPFLAMVGDQRHGTNVEAPLSVIREAVASVMEDHTAGNMAGHEATVQVLQQILEAVLGIEISDSVIDGAVRRSRSNAAVMRGGSF